ncbi:hypothetical protein HQQ94_10640 [Shewanella sp. VB17]|uniref:hypothetical protein n=1 Tax=Shewanella sp. VB17 TaxID=2739432 RepID=UPI0015643D76|nr:hypothetical protein [Shewanella sp. VB17]NRD73688.1 hypothetical protein [Shewanella sp. VB17]
MGFFNKIKTQANTIGTNISDSTAKLGGDIFTSTKDNAKLIAIKAKISSIEGQLHIGYQGIGKKYVENLMNNEGKKVEDVLADTLSSIEPLLEKKITLENEAIEIEKSLKDQIKLQEKAIFQKEYDSEKEKLDRALKMEIISEDDHERRLGNAKRKLDNFDTIRKLKKQHEMKLITEDELTAKLISLGA